jgi:hypothetical protein
MKQLITLEEACKLTPYTADYLGQLIRKGRLDAWKEKGRWLTTRIAVEEYMLKVAEESFRHHENLIEKIPEMEKGSPAKWKWAYLALGVILIAGSFFGSYAYLGSKEVGVCGPYEIAEDKNGNEIVRVGNREYVRNIFAAAGKNFAKLEF